MNFFRTSLTVAALSGLIFLSSCKEDPELPDNLVEFESDALGITSTESELTINISLSREATAAASLVVQVEPTGLSNDTDFTTEPATSASTITIPVVSGALAVSFKVKKVATALFDGDEKIVFTIATAPESLVLGEKTQLTLSFAEIVAATGSMELNGGGAAYPNKVFIDLSANRQTAIARTSWDLGFSSGADFRAILNSSNGMMAYVLDKTDLASVTNADTAIIRNRLSMEAVFAAINSSPIPEWTSSALTWIDDPAGDLTKTAIGSISSVAAENKVYIINRGSGSGTPAPALGWKKIKIIRTSNGYSLQHADINSTSFTEIQIIKNAASEFQYVSFANGLIEVEPERDRWDISWTAFSNSTFRNPAASDFTLVPYYFQDVILQNRFSVQVAQILTSVKTYEAFVEADLTGFDFGAQSQTKIGTSWRSGGGPGASPAVRTDRFYVIKDADNNYYKLKFTALTTSGERGKPKLEFALVKKGS